MGCCVSSPSAAPAAFPEGNSSSRAITTSPPQSNTVLSRPSVSSQSNRPQRHAPPQRLSTHIDRPLRLHVWTATQQLWNRVELDREREEFFHTRVTGRPEVWQAIKVALEVLWMGGEMSDADGGLAMAQTLLTAADITIPTGDLANGAYDSFGAFYQLPEHIVADPINLAEVPNQSSTEEDKRETNEIEGEVEEEEEEERRKEEYQGAMIDLKARLSDGGGHDLVVKIGKDESVRVVTKRILEASKHIPPKHIRIAYRGKLLAPHKSLYEQDWQEGDIVNAMVFG